MPPTSESIEKIKTSKTNSTQTILCLLHHLHIDNKHILLHEYVESLLKTDKLPSKMEFLKLFPDLVERLMFFKKMEKIAKVDPLFAELLSYK